MQAATATLYFNIQTEHWKLSGMMFPTAFPPGLSAPTQGGAHPNPKAKAPSHRKPEPRASHGGGLGLRSGFGRFEAAQTFLGSWSVMFLTLNSPAGVFYESMFRSDCLARRGRAPARGSYGGPYQHQVPRWESGQGASPPRHRPQRSSSRSLLTSITPPQPNPSGSGIRLRGWKGQTPSQRSCPPPPLTAGPFAAAHGESPGRGRAPHLSASRSRQPRAPLPRAHGRRSGWGRHAPGHAPGRYRPPRARARPIPIATRWDGAGPPACCRSRTSPLLHQDGGRAVGLVPSIGFAAGRLEVTPGPAREGRGRENLRWAGGRRRPGAAAGRLPSPAARWRQRREGRRAGCAASARPRSMVAAAAIGAARATCRPRTPHRAGARGRPRAPLRRPGAPLLRPRRRAARQRTKAMSHVPLPSPAAHRPGLGPHRAEGAVAFPSPSAGGGSCPVPPGPDGCGLSKGSSLHSRWSRRLRLRRGPRWGRVLASPVPLQVASAASVHHSRGNSASADLLSMPAVWFYFGLFIDRDDPAALKKVKHGALMILEL